MAETGWVMVGGSVIRVNEGRTVGEARRRLIRPCDRRWEVLYRVKASDVGFTVRNVSTRLGGEDVVAWRSYGAHGGPWMARMTLPICRQWIIVGV